MFQRNILSYQFNMSLGFIPAIISMLLYLWKAEDIFIYIGTGIGLLVCLLLQVRKKVGIPNLLLFSTTGMLTFFSLFSLIADKYNPPALLLTLEIITIFPPTLLYINRHRVLAYGNRYPDLQKRLFNQSVEASLVSSKIILILGILHFLAITGISLIQTPISSTLSYLLFHIAPPSLLILSIALNQLCIFLFNRLTAEEPYLPVVNTQGNVINKIPASEVLNYKNQPIIPVIRIAITTQGMLYLKSRKECDSQDEKYDLTIEGALFFNETIEKGVKRLIVQSCSQADIKSIHFRFKYHYKNENENKNQLVYLFVIELKKNAPLFLNQEQGGKFWTLQQIEANLEKHYFSRHFEQEYDYLKSTIYTTEKYKES